MTEEDSLWEDGAFIESVGPEDMEKIMRTFHMKHDEEMVYNCAKCDTKISAHNKDWHNGIFNECFDKECFSQ